MHGLTKITSKNYRHTRCHCGTLKNGEEPSFESIETMVLLHKRSTLSRWLRVAAISRTRLRTPEPLGDH